MLGKKLPEIEKTKFLSIKDSVALKVSNLNKSFKLKDFNKFLKINEIIIKN